MHRYSFIRSIVTCILACSLVHPGRALVSIDDGKNRMFVNISANYTWDSNIFASRNGGGDSIFSASMGLDYARKAGVIAVNAGVSVDASNFVQNTGENFQNPRFNLEFTKQSGRTTGSLLFNAARQSRADTAANLRNESWLYEAGLNLKYPVIERYSLAGGVGYSLRDFKDNTVLVDLTTYTANLDLFYIYNTERDLIAGYRVRYGETSSKDAYYDHAFTVGISGKILPKLGGTVRFGYQLREPSKGSSGESFSAFTASGSATWSATKKTNVSFNISKDFTTTSTNATVDSSSVELMAQHAINSKFTTRGGLGYGINDFLGSIGGGRRDQYFTWNVGANYDLLGERLKLGLSYSYLYNWSTLSFSTFERNSVTFSASSRF